MFEIFLEMEEASLDRRRSAGDGISISATSRDQRRHVTMASAAYNHMNSITSYGNIVFFLCSALLFYFRSNLSKKKNMRILNGFN